VAGLEGLKRFDMPPPLGSRRTPWRHGGDTAARYDKSQCFIAHN